MKRAPPLIMARRRRKIFRGILVVFLPKIHQIREVKRAPPSIREILENETRTPQTFDFKKKK